MSSDTVELLKECDQGVKMAVKNLDEITKDLKDKQLESIIADSRKKHIILKQEIEKTLTEMGEELSEPNIIAESMGYIKTNVKFAIEKTDKTAADLITDGCNMGIKTLTRYLNQYENADEKAKCTARAVIATEESLLDSVRPYL